jgi:hypothetical protein
MTWEDQVFIADVVVTDPMWETVASSVISWPTNAIVELNIIAKIRKYGRLHEGHHFIPMAMEVHNALKCDLDRFTKECVHLFHARQSRDHLSLFFFIQFFK